MSEEQTRSVLLVVSTTRAEPLTVSVSVTAPTLRPTSRRTSSLTRTTTPGDWNVWKPVSSADTV